MSDMASDDREALTDASWEEHVRSKTQILDILLRQFGEIKWDHIQPAYYLAAIITDDQGKNNWQRFPMLLGEELERCTKIASRAGFVRWATLDDRIRAAKAMQEAFKRRWNPPVITCPNIPNLPESIFDAEEHF